MSANQFWTDDELGAFLIGPGTQLYCDANRPGCSSIETGADGRAYAAALRDIRDVCGWGEMSLCASCCLSFRRDDCHRAAEHAALLAARTAA